MNLRDSRAMRVLPLFVAVTAAGVVTLAVAVGSSLGPGEPTALMPVVAASPTSEDQPDPNEDINSLKIPKDAPTGDKSTVKPPTDDRTFDAKKDFETGIFSDDGAPAPSIQFLANNYWSGFVGETPVSVYAGYAGYEHPKDGAVFVVYVSESGGFESGSMHVSKGSGPLSVVDVIDGAINLKSDDGIDFRYDLKAEELRPV